MIIKKLKAKNFRNIDECEIEFSDGVNILIGENAQGKTNAVEGIYFFARGKFFRAVRETDACYFGRDNFSLEIEYEEKGKLNKLSYNIYQKEKKILKNGYKINRINEMIGSFRAILFSPDDLRLVKDSPEERRAFLNIAISQQNKSYIKYYSLYKKALENRNVILSFLKKGLYTDENELYSWSKSLAEYASYLYIMRKEYINRLSRFAKGEMKKISGDKEELEISYKSDIESNTDNREDIEREYIRVFSENIERERAAGVSLFGIQRDDIEIIINGKNARQFASQGQIRSIVLALKMAEGEIIKEDFSEYPVYLLDDVLSELDERRRAYVLSKRGERQIIITSCEYGDYITSLDRVIEVEGGKYVFTHR